MEYEQIKEKAKKLINENNLKRDDFIFILNNIEVDSSLEFKKKGETLHIVFEDWMLEKFSKRKMYEEVSGIVGKNEVIDIEDIDTSSAHVLELMKKVQSLHDSNVKLRKHYRDSFRPVISDENLFNEIKESIKNIDFNTAPKSIFSFNGERKGILHLSDLHLDMLIQEPRNVFDFDIASKRLRKHIEYSIKLFKDNNISEVFILNTSDTISSNRRDSEKNNRATSRGRAFSIALKLLSLVIKDMANNFNIYYATCSANESRIEKDHEYDDFALSDNFDIMLHNSLEVLFEDSSVTFIETDHAEGIVSIYPNFKVLMLHGSNVPDSGMQKKITELKGKHASAGELIDFVIMGDKHSSVASNKFARSASLCGSNGYSDSCLGFDSRAAQHCYIVHKDKSVDCYVKDLQETDGIEGYDIENELNKFKVKRLRK